MTESMTSRFTELLGADDLIVACERAVARCFGELPVQGRLEAIKRALEQRGVEFRTHVPSATKPFEGKIDYRPSSKVTISTSDWGSGSRQRFTLAHEIGHWIARSITLPQGWHAEGTNFRAVAFALGTATDEERLANLLASEILMPRQETLRLASAFGHQPTMAAVRGLAGAFGTSRIAMLRRLCDLQRSDAVLLSLIKKRQRNQDSPAVVDQAVFIRGGVSTLYARESTCLIEEPRFSDLAAENRRSLGIRGPWGKLEHHFEFCHIQKGLESIAALAVMASESAMQPPASEAEAD